MTESSGQRHWIPERLLDDAGQTSCRWIDVGDVRYADPFFEMTLAKCRWARAGCETSSLQEVYERAQAASTVEPTALLFHVSRCGSTLVSQLLGLDERAIVLSEPPILDEVLRSSLPDRESLFVATLRLLCRRRFGVEERAFLKTDCWHVLDAAVLRRCFPNTPFLLLYRSPEAVLASHRRARGMHMVPGLVTGAMAEISYDPVRHSLDDYAAAVLERLYRAMLEVASTDSNSLLLSYEEGFPAVFFRLAKSLGLGFDEEALRRIRERCGYHAKAPQESFREETTASLAGVDLSTLWTLYRALEDRRNSRARGEDETTRRIVAFLVEVGFPVERHEIRESTFLPGITVRDGVLLFDPSRLEHPGDLLHEAGHLAVLPRPERQRVSGSFGEDGGNEMAAIAWSFAACRHLGLPLDVLFHAEGYKGDAASLAENFTEGRYVGVPMLEWRGMTRTRGEPVYPAMLHWLCP